MNGETPQEINPNLSWEAKQALSNPESGVGSGKLNSILLMAVEGELSKKIKAPLSNIKSGAPFLRGVVGGENISRPDPVSDFNGNRLRREGFKPAVSEITKPIVEAPSGQLSVEPSIPEQTPEPTVSSVEQIYFDPSLMKLEVKGGETLNEILN